MVPQGLSFYIDVGPECSNVVKVLRDLIGVLQPRTALMRG
jgi:hypothetical protein